MTTQRIVHTLTILTALGMVAFSVTSAAAQPAGDPWETWIDEQTDAVLRAAGEIDEMHRAEMRDSVRSKFSALAAELKKELASPPQTQDYALLQNVKELRAAYDEAYDLKHKDMTVHVSYTIDGTEIFAYEENIPLAEVDAKYPRNAWLQMLLDKGIRIKDAEAYWEYLFLRDKLLHIKRQPNVWISGLFGIPATEDWETYEAAYIERECNQIQKRLKAREKRGLIFNDLAENLHNPFFDKHKVLEEVFEDLPNFPQEFSWQVLKVPQTVKALQDAYDERYNERYAMTSGNVTWTRDDRGTIFAYKFPLPMSEVDGKYPRDEWLQMLLDKGIRIDNFEEYWAYLSNRDTLVELEKQPKVWLSGLFGIPPTKDWETYKAAYLKQMVKKFHPDRKTMYFGKADAMKVLEEVQRKVAGRRGL